MGRVYLLCLCLVFCLVVLVDGNPKPGKKEPDVDEVNPQKIESPDEKAPTKAKGRSRGQRREGDDDDEGGMYIPPKKLKEESKDKDNEDSDGPPKEMHKIENCWINVDVAKHFEVMDRLDEKHFQVRKDFETAVMERNLDAEMLEMMLQTRAAAERAVHNAQGYPSRIPAGINLGGYGIMKVEKALLFFHRMKLRNSTNFRVNYLHNDIFNMVMSARLDLNDLLLFGSYERAITENDALFYRPTFGELEVLLKDVKYKMEGRLRLVQSRLVVEHVISEMHMKDILMMYYVNGSTSCQTSENIKPSDIADFLERLKADLDMWLKDYFNDYLLYFALTDAAANHELHCYDKQKTLYLNDFVDATIKIMHAKLHALTPPAGDIKTPAFTIFSVNGVQIRLHSGVIRGFDSFYRQSVATGRKQDKIRMADAVMAFSKLKIEYKYLAKVNGRSPPMTGLFSLTADDMIAHLGLTVVKEPMAIDIVVNYLRSHTPQTLVIEGAINRMVGNFKHVLELEIIALMMNALIYHIKQLATLTRCEPNIEGHDDGEGNSNENNDGSNDDAGKWSGPDFRVQRNDSIELEVPGDKAHPPKSMNIKFQENFELRESPNPDGEHITEAGPEKSDEIIVNPDVSDEKLK